MERDLFSFCLIYYVNFDMKMDANTRFTIVSLKLVVSLLSDFPKDLIYVPCGISQDRIVRLPSLNALFITKG